MLQAIRTLLWDLSYFLPGWLLAPVLLLGLGLIVGVGFSWDDQPGNGCGDDGCVRGGHQPPSTHHRIGVMQPT